LLVLRISGFDPNRTLIARAGTIVRTSRRLRAEIGGRSRRDAPRA
jgi:hypothetical protein